MAACPVDEKEAFGSAPDQNGWPGLRSLPFPHAVWPDPGAHVEVVTTGALSPYLGWGRGSSPRRKMSSEWRDYLHHILNEVEYLLETRSGLTYEAFESDGTLRRAFVSNIPRTSGIRWQRFVTV